MVCQKVPFGSEAPGGTVLAFAQSGPAEAETRESVIPYLSGALTGIILTIVVVFLIDHVGDKPGGQDIVNWDYVRVELGQGTEKVADEVREGVHKATAPEPEETPEPGTHGRACAGARTRHAARDHRHAVGQVSSNPELSSAIHLKRCHS